MKITKNEGGVYVASFRTAEGKTKSISTKSRNADDAKRIVKESGIADLEMAAKAGRLTREAIGYITTGKKLTMRKAVAAWTEWMSNVGRSPKTIYNSLTSVNSWLRDEKLESLPPSAITEKHISAWINGDGDSKYGTRAVNLAAIRSFFGLCCARGWSIGNPSQEVTVKRDDLTHDQIEPDVREPFTTPEIKQLIEDCKDRKDTFWHFAVSISSELGLRLGAICQLEWDCFERAGFITITKNKRHKRLELPISPDIADLVTLIPVQDHRYLFPEQRGMIVDIKRRAGLSVQFKRMCDRLGIEGKSFHCLRHTVATNKFAKADKATLARKLVDALTLEEIGALLGHSNTKTTEGYVH